MHGAFDVRLERGPQGSGTGAERGGATESLREADIHGQLGQKGDRVSFPVVAVADELKRRAPIHTVDVQGHVDDRLDAHLRPTRHVRDRESERLARRAGGMVKQARQQADRVSAQARQQVEEAGGKAQARVQEAERKAAEATALRDSVLSELRSTFERISQLARSEGSAEAAAQGEGAVPAPPVPTRPA